MSDLSSISSSSVTKSVSSVNLKQSELENPCQLECHPIYIFQGRLCIKFINASHAQNIKTIMDLLVKFCLMSIGAVTLFLMFAVFFLHDCYPQLTFHSEKVVHGYLCAFAMQFWFPFAYLLVNQFNGTGRGWKSNHLIWTFAIFKFTGTAMLFSGVFAIFFKNHLKRSPKEELMMYPIKPISNQAKCERDNMSAITRRQPPMWLTFYELSVSHYLFGLLATTFAILDLMSLLLLALPEHEKGRNYAVSGIFLLNIPFIICNGLCLLFLSFYLLDTEWNQRFLNFAGLFNIFLIFFILFDVLMRKFAPNFLFKRDCKIIKPNKSDILTIGRQISGKGKKKRKKHGTKSKKMHEEDKLSRSSSWEKIKEPIKSDKTGKEKQVSSRFKRLEREDSTESKKSYEEDDLSRSSSFEKTIKPHKCDKMGIGRQVLSRFRKKKRDLTSISKKMHEEDEVSRSSSKKTIFENDFDSEAIERSEKHIAKAKAKNEKMIKVMDQALKKAKSAEAKAHEHAIKEYEKARERQQKKNEKAERTICKAQEKARKKMEIAKNVCGRAISRAKEQGERDITEAERVCMKIIGMKPPGLDKKESSTSLSS